MTSSSLTLLEQLIALADANPSATHEWLARECSGPQKVSRSRVTNLLRVASLPPPIRDWILAGKLSIKHGEALLSQPEAKRLYLAQDAMAYNWSVSKLKASYCSAEAHPSNDADVAALESSLGQLLGTTVTIETGKGSTGWLKIWYADYESLDGVLERLGYQA